MIHVVYDQFRKHFQFAEAKDGIDYDINVVVIYCAPMSNLPKTRLIVALPICK